jgi:hypothetical protein
VTDASPTAAPAPPRKPLFTFTDDGCRTELRCGALLIAAGAFLWLFIGPTWATRLCLIGAPLLLIGCVLQAVQARRGLPGYPWKLALGFLILGLPMCFDLRYREAPGAELHRIAYGPILAAAGAWLALWWPLAAFNRRAWSRRQQAGA